MKQSNVPNNFINELTLSISPSIISARNTTTSAVLLIFCQLWVKKNQSIHIIYLTLFIFKKEKFLITKNKML